MKEIKAFIKPFKLNAVMLELSAIEGLTGMSYNRVEGYGRGRGSDGPIPFAGEEIRFLPYIKLEIVCRDEVVDRVVEVIHRAAHTGLRGDGKIYVSEVLDAVRISTGEHGEEAV